jgi:hypothetical protein
VRVGEGGVEKVEEWWEECVGWKECEESEEWCEELGGRGVVLSPKLYISLSPLL